MKRSILIAAIFVLSPVVLFAQKTAKTEPNTGTLTVLVTGLKNDEGEVRFALTNSEESYSSKDAKPYRGIKVPIREKKAAAMFENLPFGEYAIKLFHDRNGNGKLDTKLGIPNEDYAFSNGARGAFAPPKYEKARFVLNKEQMTIEIEIPTKE